MPSIKIQLITVIFILTGVVASAQERSDTLAREMILHEVNVTPGKEKYSKKNNPAVEFVNRIRKMSDASDPYNADYYNYVKYERNTLAVNEAADSTGQIRGLLKQFTILKDYLDTADVTGKPILPLCLRERVSEIMYRKNPKAQKEYITGITQIGYDAFSQEENIQTFLDDILREIDLYNNDISLLENRFVSPLSKIGPDFYKYYLTDTISLDGQRCIELTFAPRNNALFGFTGKLYVPENDSTMFIRKAILYLPQKANVNFVDFMKIEQTFDRDSLGRRLKTSDILSVEFSLIQGIQGLYAQRYTTYGNHSFDIPQRQAYLDHDAKVFTSADAFIKPDEFWAQYRGTTSNRPRGEAGSILIALRNYPVYYWGEKILKILVGGYVTTGQNSKFDIGPVNTFISFNDLEGARLRLGGLTTANLNKHWFGRGYIAYGTKDRRWKYNAEVEYSFNEKKYHSREFPMHSIRLSHSYNVDAIGQNYAFTNSDNFFLSWKRMKDTLMLYERQTQLQYILELQNNFSLTASLRQKRLEGSHFLKFRMADGQTLSHINTNVAEIVLRYAPDELYYQTRTHRDPVNYDKPIFLISHSFGSKGIGNRYTINRTEFNAIKRFWFSAFGYTDIIIKGGHIWSQTPYTELFTANTNLTYTIQPESFALMTPLEFLSDSYISAFIAYKPNGIIFNSIPGIKKLKLREVFSLRGYLGRLSDRNNPSFNRNLPLFPEGSNPVAMHGTPYLEVSAGIENLLRFIRLEYVWRLTYRHTPGVDRSGLRVALHFSF